MQQTRDKYWHLPGCLLLIVFTWLEIVILLLLFSCGHWVCCAPTLKRAVICILNVLVFLIIIHGIQLHQQNMTNIYFSFQRKHLPRSICFLSLARTGDTVSKSHPHTLWCILRLNKCQHIPHPNTTCIYTTF